MIRKGHAEVVPFIHHVALNENQRFIQQEHSIPVYVVTRQTLN